MRALTAAIALAALPAAAATDVPWRMASGVPCAAVVQAAIQDSPTVIILRVHNPTTRGMDFLTLVPDVTWTDGRTTQQHRQSPRYVQHRLPAGATGDFPYSYFTAMPVVVMVEVSPIACM